MLLDLPDIDSRYASHLQVTRTMLRHMLYPVWVGSIEKYADQQPQQMLARVAEGNTPENFVFCLNRTRWTSWPVVSWRKRHAASGKRRRNRCRRIGADVGHDALQGLEVEEPASAVPGGSALAEG